jgi:hypothetical protein
MKPDFALSLSFEGISLLQRASDGWRNVGEVALDASDLAAGLAGLCDKARALGPKDLHCKIIIPNDQIRYLTIETGSFDGEAHMLMIRQALDGATPYPVSELAYDISVDGATTFVAAVARETLAEAEAFAVEHGFAPLSFVAMPGDNPFTGEPFFGPSAHAATLPGAPEVEPDDIKVLVVGPAEVPEPAVAGFSSRRTAKPKEDAPDVVATIEPSPEGAKPNTPAPTADLRAAFDEADTPEPISVTAPSLEIPEFSEPESLENNDAVQPGQTSDQKPGLGGFLSRRQKTRPMPHATSALPRVPTSPAPLLNRALASGPEVTAISRPAALTHADEAARMTVFGAREETNVGGKSQHLGLILAAALLVFLAAVAAWASIFLDQGVAGLFRISPAKTELAAVPDTPIIGTRADEPSESTKTENQPRTVIAPTDPTFEIRSPDTTAPVDLAQLPPTNLDIAALPAPQRLDAPVQPTLPVLSDTDSAVLAALREPAPLAEETAPPPSVDPIATFSDQNGPDITYAATGIWQSAPKVPNTPSIIGLDDLYVASIDRTDLSHDAVAVPTARSLATDLPLGAINSPVAADTTFDFAANGLVIATPKGALNPDGVTITLGRPSKVPPARPASLTIEPDTEIAPAQLAGKRPRLRPNDLAERFERSNLGGLSWVELSELRPKARPEGYLKDAEQKVAQEPTSDEAPAISAEQTAQATVYSKIPRARPKNFAALVSAATRPARASSSVAGVNSSKEQVATIAPRTVTPKIPSSASVSRQATLNNAINLRRVNLIGVYGTPSNRRALVRLPSGRYKKVKVGDSVDGGRIVAIGDSELRYQKSGRNLTLKIPSG